MRCLLGSLKVLFVYYRKLVYFYIACDIPFFIRAKIICSERVKYEFFFFKPFLNLFKG